MTAWIPYSHCFEGARLLSHTLPQAATGCPNSGQLVERSSWKPRERASMTACISHCDHLAGPGPSSHMMPQAATSCPTFTSWSKNSHGINENIFKSMKPGFLASMSMLIVQLQLAPNLSQRGHKDKDPSIQASIPRVQEVGGRGGNL